MTSEPIDGGGGGFLLFPPFFGGEEPIDGGGGGGGFLLFFPPFFGGDLTPLENLTSETSYINTIFENTYLKTLATCLYTANEHM